MDIVQYLLGQGADKDKITLDYSQYTALHLAVSKCHYDAVEVLLAAGADTELYTATGCCGTALHLASSMGDARLCLSLISTGSNVAAVSEEGSSVLHYLAIRSKLIKEFKGFLRLALADLDQCTSFLIPLQWD